MDDFLEIIAVRRKQGLYTLIYYLCWLLLIACALIVASLLCALPAFAENAGDYSAQLPAFVNQVSIWKPKSNSW